MIPKTAIEKAMEGGWDDRYFTSEMNVADVWQIVALDPSFWVSLGKALGWDPQSGESFRTSEAFYKAHRFYDRILTGRDTQKFWDELLV